MNIFVHWINEDGGKSNIRASHFSLRFKSPKQLKEGFLPVTYNMKKVNERLLTCCAYEHTKCQYMCEQNVSYLNTL